MLVLVENKERVDQMGAEDSLNLGELGIWSDGLWIASHGFGNGEVDEVLTCSLHCTTDVAVGRLGRRS